MISVLHAVCPCNLLVVFIYVRLVVNKSLLFVLLAINGVIALGLNLINCPFYWYCLLVSVIASLLCRYALSARWCASFFLTFSFLAFLTWVLSASLPGGKVPGVIRYGMLMVSFSPLGVLVCLCLPRFLVSIPCVSFLPLSSCLCPRWRSRSPLPGDKVPGVVRTVPPPPRHPSFSICVSCSDYVLVLFFYIGLAVFRL